MAMTDLRVGGRAEFAPSGLTGSGGLVIHLMA
ncbi:hypothetical protein N825_34980 [Skermanella stibiiresistens SB22]|uniref:Uncharacterized protein n=1 Tax=Skermanella stibiiresistens SB22 TaxID=1385369 RepID=W9H7C9_9PROT|nr:hypothetical protein N825_34980 [Skermanella stibiiresistens SB22]